MITFGENNGMKNNPIDDNVWDLPKLSKKLPPLHLILSVVAPSGAGKTTAVCNLLKQYIKEKAFDWKVIMSPTALPNEKTGLVSEPKWKKLNFDEMYDNLNPSNFEEFLDNQLDRINEYKDHLEQMKIYKRIMAKDETLTDKELLDYINKNGYKKPKCRFKRMPICLLVLDDVTNAARNPILSEFVSKSRHYNVSVCCLSQSLKQQNPTFRQNSNCLMIFKTQNKKVIEDIYDEFASSDMSKETFEEMMALPQKKNNFIMICQKNPIETKYRLNFDQYLKV